MTDENTSYVGYGHPPKDKRFKKGRSGNPRGRPRKREDMNAVLQRVLNRKVPVKGEEKKMPIREALVLKLRELALQGDKQAWALQRQILTDAGYDEPDPTSFEEKQKELHRQIDKFGEFLRARKEGNDG